MANQEQLDILKQGVKLWNEWREENSDIEIELLNADFNGAHLEGVDLSFAELSGAYLQGADLTLPNSTALSSLMPTSAMLTLKVLISVVPNLMVPISKVLTSHEPTSEMSILYVPISTALSSALRNSPTPISKV